MSRRLSLIILVCLAAVSAVFLAKAQKSAVTGKVLTGPMTSPVVVELFTSEGCSSCPPADKLLADLDRDGNLDGIPVIALGEHVDYWDGQGWRDRFSSREFTERQQQFVDRLKLESAYTPQMVVDGRLEFVGNDDSALRQALGQAAQKSKTAEVKLAWESDGALNVTVLDNASHSASVLLAITESALTTKVGGGENTGRELHHAAVVRRMTRLGSVKDSRFVSNAKVKIDSGWKKENLKAVVFVQDERTGAVLGASELAFPR